MATGLHQLIQKQRLASRRIQALEMEQDRIAAVYRQSEAYVARALSRSQNLERKDTQNEAKADWFTFDRPLWEIRASALLKYYLIKVVATTIGSAGGVFIYHVVRGNI